MRRDVHNDHPGSVEHFQRSKIFVHQGEFAAGPKSYVFHDDRRMLGGFTLSGKARGKGARMPDRLPIRDS